MSKETKRSMSANKNQSASRSKGNGSKAAARGNRAAAGKKSAGSAGSKAAAPGRGKSAGAARTKPAAKGSAGAARNKSAAKGSVGAARTKPAAKGSAGAARNKSAAGAGARVKKGLGAGVAATDPGAAAYQQLLPRLEKIAAERVTQPRTQPSAAASFVLSSIVPQLADKRLSARFATLPAAEFDHSALADLGPAAQAALWAQAQLAAADAGTPGGRLPVDLIDQATELRQLMLTVCEYHFRDDPRLGRQLSDIRSGSGYLDLAEDLQRLGALYRSERDTLKQDLRFYKAADAATALQLAQRITSELRFQTALDARQLAWRTWALLLELYEEVARGGRFLLREAGEAVFPPLHVAGRTPVRRSRPANAPTPDSPPAPQAQ